MLAFALGAACGPPIAVGRPTAAQQMFDERSPSQQPITVPAATANRWAYPLAASVTLGGGGRDVSELVDYALVATPDPRRNKLSARVEAAFRSTCGKSLGTTRELMDLRWHRDRLRILIYMRMTAIRIEASHSCDHWRDQGYPCDETAGLEHRRACGADGGYVIEISADHHIARREIAASGFVGWPPERE